VISHLLMHSYSVVIGDKASLVEKWVCTLSNFLLPEEYPLCRISGSEAMSFNGNNVFVPELFVQGILSNSKDPIRSCLPYTSLISSRYPISVVDLNNKIIWSFKRYSYFVTYKAGANDYPLLLSHKKQEKEKAFKEGFQRCTFQSEMVSELFDTIFKIDPRIRTSYISEWMKMLVRKAAVLIKYTQQLSLATPTTSQQQQQLASLKSSLNQDLKNLIGLKSDTDLRIVLAAAEKLQAGTYVFVEGDRLAEANQVIELFEDF